MPAHQLYALREERFGGLQRRQLAPDCRDHLERPGELPYTEQRHGSPLELRHEPDPHCRQDGERPFAPGQQLPEVVSGVVFHKPRHPSHDAAIGKDRLEAEHLPPHRPVANHPDAARVGRHHPADCGAVA